MGISSPGIGSGLDIVSIVTASVNASFAPRTASFNAQEAQINTQISALGNLKSALSAFQESAQALQKLDAFDKRTVSSSDSSTISATASSDSKAGSYNMVVSQLATNQKLGTAAVESADSTFGTGSLTIAVGPVSIVDGEEVSSSLTIDIGEEDTLADIAAKINDSDDNPGVTATIVNGRDGPQLVITSDKTGVENEMSISATGSDALTGLFGDLTELQAAQDAEISIDGITVTSASNTISNAIEGLTLELKEANPDKNVTINVAMDVDGVKSSIEEFVNNFNALQSTLGSLTSYDAATETAGALQGDSLARGISSMLRSTVGNSYDVGGQNSSLSAFGVTFNQSGQLEIDDTKLTEAITGNMSQLSALFSSEDTGLAYALDDRLENYLMTGGSFDSRDDTLQRQLARIESSRTLLAMQQSAYESRLYSQYNAMDAILYNLSTQSANLVSSLSSLPGLVSNNNK
ncbi:MAG: flagellar filament capping protein FliD [Ferrimonas sp.]